MRAGTSVVALCAATAALACAGSHVPRDGGADSAATDDAGALEPCSPAVFDEFRFLDVHLCHDPLVASSGGWPIEEDGLPTVTADALAPMALTPTDRGVVLEGVLAHRFEERIGDEPPVLIAASVRYRIRLDDPAPFAALEEAVAIAPEVAIAELRATNAETDCAAPGTDSGRLVCTSAGRWDVWAHAASVDYADPGNLSLVPPSLAAIALIDRVGRRAWWLRLQGLPDACEHEPGVLPSEPCRPDLAPAGAWATFAVPAETYDGGAIEGPGPFCPLQLTCVPCCRPVDSPYECRDRGFHRCEENASWLDAACMATRLDDVPLPRSPPCLNTDEFALSPCGGASFETDCF